MERYRVLLGGLGDDAHSIGIALIRVALEEKGHIVTNMGIQNTIHDFLENSFGHEIVMISCVNGHSELYLDQDDYNLIQERYQDNKLWYIGGNLSVNKSADFIVRMYTQRGFTGVFPKPVDIEEILTSLKRDIEKYEIHVGRYSPKPLYYSKLKQGEDNYLKNDFHDIEQFEQMREKILLFWKTGRDVTYELAIENHRRNKNMNQVLNQAKLANRDPLIQPRTGVADLDKQITLLQQLERCGIDIASVQLDAASRRLYFDKAQEGVEKSISVGFSELNGFPVPIHGVKGIQRIAHSLALPFQIRGGAPDHRFVFEIAIAGGASSVEGGFLSYLLPYEKMLDPETCSLYWKYIDTLCGLYNRMGIVINREFFGPLTSTLIEPSIAIVINIVESLFAASYGVKSISVGLAEQGNRSQDVAAIRVLEHMTKGYLKKYRYNDVRVTTVFHQYMGAFPANELKAEKLIEASAVTASISGATRILTKTPVEAYKIPDLEDNIRGVTLTQRGIKASKDQKPNYSAVAAEQRILEAEVSSVMHVIEGLGDGNIVKGAIWALREGIIDVPFSPNIHNHCKAVQFRNINGAIRLSKLDHLPFPEWVKEVHQEDLYKRMTFERDYTMTSILEKDLTRISKCEYKQWPLDTAVGS